MRTFVNAILGETWKEKGDAPPWKQIYERREKYPIGTVPAGGLMLTAGVDVQEDKPARARRKSAYWS
jgi:phage terminase large subunit GpA-like protein